ncbi:putative ABC transport system permease protein [Microbacterium sp. W4I4]|uniref:FtsX-like permease family protein n=1 Tax=Microbacterium sp. W4I4 TaxID=3042295 RepID=UPI002784AC90|nr:FtsX-like permease family protein [Microbacterium sp. W4I4]MDQ0613278.1 putative ABC transport system permease protein [Microbacterium sp. W4I4]
MSRRARPGVTFTLAWRQLLRTAGSSVLITGLIAVPVAAAAGVLTFAESRTPTIAQTVDLELGETQSWIRIEGGADPSRMQAIDSPRMTQTEPADDGSPKHPELPAPTDLSDAGLPAGTEAIPLAAGYERVTTPTGIAGFSVIYGKTWDPRLTGRFDLISGRAPQSSHEAMASPDLLERLGATVGDDIELPDRESTVRVVGTMRAMDGGTYRMPLFLPTSAQPEGQGDPPQRPDTTWFLPGWQPDMAQLAELNHTGYVAYARDLVLDPPPGAFMATNVSSMWATLMVVSLGLVFGGLLVGLLAAAAMAVSARRQQRSLAVLSTVGARRGDVFRTVLIQGGVLGLAGGLIGAAIGVGGVALVNALLDPGVKNTFWSSWGLTVPWSAVGVVVFAVLVGLAASVIPARAATRGDALAALRGARRPVRMSLRRPVVGIVIALIGGALVAGGGVLFGVLAGRDDWNAPLQTTALWASIIGVLLLLLSVTLSGQGILALLTKLLARFGSAARLASRDAVANSPRTVPAFVSIAASTAVAVFVLCAIAIPNAQSERIWAWAAPKGSVIVSNWGEASSSQAPAFLADTRPERLLPVSAPVEPVVDTTDTTGPSPEVVYPSLWAGEAGGWIDSPGEVLRIIGVDDVEAITGVALSDTERQEFADGGAIALLAQRPVPQGYGTYVSEDDTARLAFWDAEEMYTEEAPRPVRTVALPVQVHVGVSSASPIILSPAAAEQYGVQTRVSNWVALFDDPPTDALLDRLRADAETASTAGAMYDVRVETGPDSPMPWLALVLGILSIIVIAAATISLGLARIERREDDATLAAVGATTALRRRVSAWQAVIIAGVGCLIGVLLGLAGTWALTQAMPGSRLGDAPVLWLLGIAIGLPAVIALVSLMIRPPQADLTHRTAIA